MGALIYNPKDVSKGFEPNQTNANTALKVLDIKQLGLPNPQPRAIIKAGGERDDF